MSDPRSPLLDELGPNQEFQFDRPPSTRLAWGLEIVTSENLPPGLILMLSRNMVVGYDTVAQAMHVLWTAEEDD